MDIMRSRRPTGRLFYWLLTLLLAARAVAGTGPQLTIISDVVYRANGQPAAGTIVVSWPAFNTADNKPVAAGELSIAIGAQGTVNFSLAPNEGSEPGGTYYKAVYKLTDGTSYTEYWVVPGASPTTIAAIRATVVPRQVGAQYVNRQYVDTAVSTAVHKTGDESVDGAKNFIVSPQVPAPVNGSSAVNEDYVLAAVSAISEGFVDKGGDIMSGPLLLPNAPTAPQHATNRQYVDEQVADTYSAIGFKLGRLNDTPITLATVRYASQFESVQAAVNDLNGPGTVVLPVGVTTLSGSGCNITLPGGVVLEGQSHRSQLFQTTFGNAAWPTALGGSVLKITGAGDGICMDTTASTYAVVRHVSIVGPGSGSSAGIKIRNGSLFNRIEDVTIANFSKGMVLDDTYGVTTRDVFLLGNDTGLFSGPGILNNSTFYGTRFSGNTMAANLGTCQQCEFLGKDTLVQANVNGFLLKPTVAGFKGLKIDGAWFEGNSGTYDLKFDSTTSGFSHVYLSTHHGDAGNRIQFTGANNFNGFTFVGMDANGVTLAMPSGYCGVFIDSTFASNTHDGCHTYINDNQYGYGITAEDPGNVLRTSSGVVPLWSSSPDLWMGRNGSTSLRHVNLWLSGNFKVFGQTGATQYGQVGPSGISGFNGAGFAAYSDGGSTQKFSVNGSNGNVSASGRANFNGGVCQDSAQTLCDLSGSGAPVGACTTGSTYRRTDGGSASTLYVCENAAWVANGSGSATWSSIGNPSGTQALAMAANSSTWTWNAATGSGVDLFRLTDTTSNTGTGHLLSVETASSSNLKPLQVKARGTTALEMNEFGVLTSLAGVTTSAGLTMQIGGAFVLKGRDDWASPVTLSGADFTGATSTGSNVTVRGGDTTSTSGANTGGNLLLRAGGSSSASGTPGTLQVAQTYAKDTTVTSGLLQCFKAAAAMTVGDCGNSALNSVGVAISSSNTNPVIVQFQGIATLQFDASATPSAGWFACSSATQGGKVTVQSGACAAGRQIGIVAQNGTSITSGKVFLQSR